MKAGFDAGRFLHYAPIGYENVNKDLAVDPDRAPLIRHAFELIASGNYSTTDSVLSLVTAMGLKTRRGNPLTKQSWGRLLCNPIYAGWIRNGTTRVRASMNLSSRKKRFRLSRIALTARAGRTQN